MNNVSFNVFKGDIFGCIGPNGAGKTTAIRCILDLLRPSKGEAKVFGESSSKSIPSNGDKIGTALENPGIFEELTGEDNLFLYSHILKIPKKERKTMIDLLLSFVGLEAKMLFLFALLLTAARGLANYVAMSIRRVHLIQFADMFILIVFIFGWPYILGIADQPYVWLVLPICLIAVAITYRMAARLSKEKIILSSE